MDSRVFQGRVASRNWVSRLGSTFWVTHCAAFPRNPPHVFKHHAVPPLRQSRQYRWRDCWVAAWTMQARTKQKAGGSMLGLGAAGVAWHGYDKTGYFRIFQCRVPRCSSSQVPYCFLSRAWFRCRNGFPPRTAAEAGEARSRNLSFTPHDNYVGPRDCIQQTSVGWNGKWHAQTALQAADPGSTWLI